MAIQFNGDVKNEGLSSVLIQGDSLISYATVNGDTCLDLSASARYRKPLFVRTDRSFSLDDYDGYTVSVWVTKANADHEDYTIIAQKSGTSDQFMGWAFETDDLGAWRWIVSDGVNSWRYNPTVPRQAINDGEWHQLGFTYDGIRQECQLYFDGENVALYSLSDLELYVSYTPICIGADPFAADVKMQTFNGKIDDVGIWSRPLSHAEMATLYKNRTGRRIRRWQTMDDEFNVMTWNIWHGGRHEGRQVGVDRVIDIINEANADVVVLQETYGSGEKLADALHYFYYYRSSNLSVLSRFPLAESFNMFRPFNFGSIKVKADADKEVLICPVWLNYLPNTGAYVKSGRALPDSIVAREMETRGLEAKLILSELRQLMLNKDEVPLIVAGDFNSGSHLDWTDRNHANYYGLTVNYPVSRQMIDVGFKDSYREVHPDETAALGQTWSPIFKSSMQDRIDYIYYAGKKLKAVKSRVIDSHDLGFPSDHAAVVTTFRWNGNEN